MRKLALSKDVLVELTAGELGAVAAGYDLADLQALAAECYTEFVCLERITELLEKNQ